MTRIEYRTDAGVTLILECDDPTTELEPWLATWANALDTVLGIDAAERLAPLHQPVPLVVDHTESGPRLRISEDQPPVHQTTTCRHCHLPIVWRGSLAGEQEQDPSVPGTGWADDGSQGLPFWCVNSTSSLHEPAPQL